MISNKEILAKHSEILSHQSHFNLALVFVTAFLVLISALNGFLSSSGFFSYIFIFIVEIMIVVLVVLILFMIRKTEIPSKIIKLIFMWRK